MKSYKIFLTIVIGAIFVFSLVGCEKLNIGKKGEDKGKKETPWADVPVTGTVIATVNGYPITLEDLNEEIDNYNKLVPEDKPQEKMTKREDKIKYLKNTIIQQVLLYQEALNRGLDKDPKVRGDLEKAKRQLLMLELVKRETDKVNVTSQDIEDYYNRLPEEYKKTEEERKIREIVVSSKSQANDLLVQLLQGADFASLARQYSKAKSAEKGGDLGFVKRGTKFPAFDDVAFSDALEVGDVSNVFKGPEGDYYIIKLEAKQGGKQRTLNDMWDTIKKLLLFTQQQKRIEDLVGDLSRNAKIEIEEDLIP